MRVSGIRSQNRRAVSARNRARVVAQVARGAKRVVEKVDAGGGAGNLHQTRRIAATRSNFASKVSRSLIALMVCMGMRSRRIKPAYLTSLALYGAWGAATYVYHSLSSVRPEGFRTYAVSFGSGWLYTSFVPFIAFWSVVPVTVGVAVLFLFRPSWEE